MRIEVLTRAELAEDRLRWLAKAVAAANAQPDQHIGYFDVEPDGVATELRELGPEAILVLAAEDWRLGLLAAEWDADLGRTWLHGPYAEGPQWAEDADALYAVAKERLPGGVGEHELFFDSRHERLDAFAARHGFALQGEHAIYSLDRKSAPPAPVGTEPLPASHEASFAALHASAFPRTHASAESILSGERHFRRPIAVLDGHTLLGYVAVTVEPELGSAHLEYIAVSPVEQGRGVGARLVAAAAQEAFADRRVRALNLTVSTANVGAWRVYEKAGFLRERTMRAYRTSR